MVKSQGVFPYRFALKAFLFTPDFIDKLRTVATQKEKEMQLSFRNEDS